MRKPYAPDDLRILSKQSGPQWDGEVRVALRFAADLLDAAELAVKSTQPVAELTDEDIVKIAIASRGAEPGRDGYILPLTFARAVLAAQKGKKEIQ